MIRYTNHKEKGGMAEKREVVRGIKRLQRIKTWQLFILLLLALLLTATFLRLNNIGMVERRAAVISADKTGDTESIRNNLHALQRHAAAHMNASSGPIYLEESYQRESQRLIDEAKKSNNISNDIVTRIENTCRGRFPGNWQGYVQCNATEQAKYTGQNNLQTVVQFPNPDLYRHDFPSPVWTPDFAGFSVLLCVLITGVIIIRLVMLGILRLLLHRHYSSI